MAFKKFGTGEVLKPTDDEQLGLEYQAMLAEETDEDRAAREASARISRRNLNRRIQEETE